MKTRPNYTKFKKSHLRRPTAQSNRRHVIRSGEYALKSLENGYLTSAQIETVYGSLNRKLKQYSTDNQASMKKRLTFIWVRVFPDVPYTTTGTESRMGKGKGNATEWLSTVQRGQIMFEFSRVPEVALSNLVKYITARLPIRAKLVRYNHIG
uniref:50S ribosomal protein L16 n=1 Tax=Cavernulicola chilensis TaxID=3028028 RepID=A0A7H0WB84_9RHOD|nr:50S ribosomal protein L16 [Cavernulicola chilensis]QNR39813.1 50S ribosomal protein L16 [Cavernulicola chilensis]